MAKREKAEDRDFFVSKGFTYTAVGILTPDRSDLLVSPHEADKAIEAANTELKSKHITAKVLISKRDGHKAFGYYALRAYNHYNRNEGLKIAEGHNIFDAALVPTEINSPAIKGQITLACGPNNFSFETDLRISSGPVVGPRLLWLLEQKEDRGVMDYVEQILTGHTRIGYSSVSKWINTMYRERFSIYKRNPNFPVRDIHFLALRVEAFLGNNAWKNVDHNFPRSKDDALKVLAKRPIDGYTPALLAAANGQTLKEFQAAPK